MTVAVWSAVRAEIDGEVLLPGEPGYDDARRPAIARFAGVRPRAIVRCRSAADVTAATEAARRLGLSIAVRSGGHSFAGRSTTAGVLVDVGPMDAVDVDTAGAVVRVGAGARLGAVYAALSVHGLTPVAGCGDTVGVSGLVLGGGIGLLGRTHGLACDALVAATVVLPGGRVVECDAVREPELFWAVRGGGAAGVGIVTALRLRVVPIPPTTAFELAWPAARAVAVLDAWQRWAPDAPDGVAASLLLTVPGDPGLPPAVTVTGTVAGRHDAATVLDGLVARVGAEPREALLLPGGYLDAKRRLKEWEERRQRVAGGPPAGAHTVATSEFFDRPLPAERLVASLHADRVPGQFRELDLSPWGGAYNRTAPDATAFVHRRDRVLLKHATTADAEELPAAEGWLRRSAASVRAWGTGRSYQNFPDPGLPDEAGAYYGGNRSRLSAVAPRYGG